MTHCCSYPLPSLPAPLLALLAGGDVPVRAAAPPAAPGPPVAAAVAVPPVRAAVAARRGAAAEGRVAAAGKEGQSCQHFLDLSYTVCTEY